MATEVENEDSGWSIKGVLTSAFKAVVATNPITAPAYWASQAFGGISADMKADALRESNTPSDLVFSELEQMEQFQGEGAAKLDEIRNDTAFVAALNKAIQGDESVADGLAGKATSGGNTLDMNTVATALADPVKRGVITQVLDKVGESNSDEFNFAYLTDVAAAGAEGNVQEVQSLLARANLQNDMVDMGADPMSILRTAVNDPQRFGQQMSQMMGLTGAQGEAFSGLFEFLGKFLQMIWGNPSDPNSIAHFADKYGPGMQQTFEDFTGITDQRRAEADNDNPDINVSASSRPTGSFNNAANGATPASSPDAAPAEPTFVERYAQAQTNAARYGMAM